MWIDPGLTAWIGIGLTGLILLLALGRPRPGGLLVVLAAGLIGAALFSPQGKRAEPLPATLLILEDGREGVVDQGRLARAALEVEERVGPFARVNRIRFGKTPLAPTRSAGDRAGWSSWPPLVPLLAVHADPSRELYVLAATDGRLTGLGDLSLPSTFQAHSRLLRCGPTGGAGVRPPQVVISLPRIPRAGRPWLALVHTRGWSPGVQLTLAVNFAGKEIEAGAQPKTDRQGRALFRCEMPPPRAGDQILVVRLKGGKQQARGQLLVPVGPAPRVATAGSGRLAGLLRSQGFEVEALSTPAIPPGTEVVAWDEKDTTLVPEAALRHYLELGGGLLTTGLGLRALAGRPQLGRLLPVMPLPPAPPSGDQGKDDTGKTPPNRAPRKSTPLPPPPEIPEKPAEERMARTASIVLVLDVSGSVKSRGLLGVLRQSCALTARALDHQDHMAVIVFADSPRVLVPMGEVGKQIKYLKRIFLQQEGNRTLLWPALNRARELLAGEKTASKLVLVFSDGDLVREFSWGNRGGGSGTNLRFGETPEMLGADFFRKGIVISAVNYTSSASQNLLDILARKTGGNAHRVMDRSKVVNAFIGEIKGFSAKRKPKKKDKPAPPRRPDQDPLPTAKAEIKPQPKKKPSPLAVTREVGGWVVADLGEMLPPVNGIIPAEPIAGRAWVPLVAGKEKFPLLAMVPPALGRIAVWSGDGGEEMARPWQEQKMLAPLLGRTVTGLLASRPLPPRPLCRWSWDRAALEIELPGWPSGWPREVLHKPLGEGGVETRGRLSWSGCRQVTMPFSGGADTALLHLSLNARQDEVILTVPATVPAVAGELRWQRFGKHLGATSGDLPQRSARQVRPIPLAYLFALSGVLVLFLATFRMRKGY